MTKKVTTTVVKTQPVAKKTATPISKTTTTKAVVTLPDKKKQKGNAVSKNIASKMLSAKAAFIRHLKMPDLYGPFRIPRVGGAVRTLLCMDRTIYTLQGDGTNPIQGLQMHPAYGTNGGSNAAVKYAAVGSGAAIGTGSNVLVGTQYPAPIQLADINFVAGCMSIQYSGTPFNAKGEIILGKSLPASTNASYTSLGYYPGTSRIQLAQYYDKPLRISAQKVSSIANEFIPGSQGQGDLELPFIFLNSNDPNITCTVEITRVWEARSTTTQAQLIPYDAEGGSISNDLADYQDALNVMGKSLFGFLSEYLPAGVSSITGITAVGALASTHMNRVVQGEHQGRLDRRAMTQRALFEGMELMEEGY